MLQKFFKRNEEKFILSPAQFKFVERVVKKHMSPDEHFRSSIHNIYFDTPQDDLVIASIESPDYKYKVRARSYGAKSADKIFFEIKSKLNGTVYKRRAIINHDEYLSYLSDGKYNEDQVMNELDYIFKEKSLMQKMYIAYDRSAYAANDDSDLRITFDTNLRSRIHELQVTKTDECEEYFPNETYIMEVKTKNGIPKWLLDALLSKKIYSTSFSKYGKIYQKHNSKETNKC